MLDAIISPLLEQLISLAVEEMKEHVRLVKGVDNEVKKLTGNLQAIQAVMNDAEQRKLKEKVVELWLDQLKYTSYDMEDVLDEWITERRKMQIEGVEYSVLPQKKVCCFFPAPCIGFKQVFLRRDIALKIKEINENLDNIARQKDMFNFHVNVSNNNEKSEQRETASFIDESEISGRIEEKKTLISKLIESSSEQKGLQIISLVGMGGVGKTTLAQLAFNNDEVKKNFDHKIWVCVSDSYDEIKIARAIIEALKGSNPNLVRLQSLLTRIQEIIEGKKILLILDDLWNEDYKKWEPFCHCLKNGSHGSKILITTRKNTVACMMESTDIIPINELAEEECWSLFQRLALSNKSIEEHEKLEEIGRKIVSKCKGLPLAAKTIASLLRFKRTEEEWQYVLDSETWEQEELEEGLFAPLLLSYNDLPSVIKRCFLYCAIFPKGYLIVKDELINLWMAQGYLSVKKNKEEITGEDYFHILAMRSFFQEFKKDYDDNIICCKMHDIVHDFAQYLSKRECFTAVIHNTLEELINSFHPKVCHSMLQFKEGASFSVSICKFQRMRSLLIDFESCGDYSSVGNVLEELFGKLTCLRALDLSHFDLRNEHIWGNWKVGIPSDVKKLVHLRYINLLGQKIEKLPETLCELYNLQILDVTWCTKLKELPQGIGKLINMRHLLNDFTFSLLFLPVGIARLTNLRILTKFVHDSQGCTFESLKNLNLLRECGIRGLGNVSDVDEAKKLELEKKENLVDLNLTFDWVGGESKNDEKILEALQPPLNLKKLFIHLYRGNTICPKWIMSLPNVRILELHDCINFEYLPPLGKLPLLERLIIEGMGSLKKLGNEFLGIESNNELSSTLSSSVISFPKLKFLEIKFMHEWEEWDFEIARTGEIMPRLSSLTIVCCPKLKALPDHILRIKTLQRLVISDCPILEERYERRTGEDWPKISHIPNFEIGQ